MVLLPALRTVGVRVVAAWSRTPRTPQWRSGPLPRGLREAELLLLSVADGAVGPLCAQLVAERLVGPGQIVAHLAGALDLSPLAPALAAGAKVGSLHPLRAIPPGSRADAFSGAAAGVEGSDDDVRGLLGALAQSLQMLPLAAAGSRALYHAAAVLAGGAQVALFAEAVRAFQAATGSSEPEARAALLPLAKGALDALAAREPAQAITGPVPRGDAETLTLHLRALESHDARTAALYRQLSRAALELSRQGARASDAQLAPIDAALAPPSRALRALRSVHAERARRQRPGGPVAKDQARAPGGAQGRAPRRARAAQDQAAAAPCPVAARQVEAAPRAGEEEARRQEACCAQALTDSCLFDG